MFCFHFEFPPEEFALYTLRQRLGSKKISGLNKWLVDFGGTVALVGDLSFAVRHVEVGDGFGDGKKAMDVVGLWKHLDRHVPGGHAVLRDQADHLCLAILERSDGTATVESVEVNPRAVRLAGRSGPSVGATRLVGRVEDVLPRLKPAQLAIVNPPRTGLATAVTDRLLDRPPDRLVYVSCDPATLARDVARLAPVYRLAAVRAFDLFPQTAHVETVVTLVRP